MTTIAKEVGGMGVRRGVTTELLARNLRRKRQHRHPAAMAIVKPVDQMHIARTATSGADRQFAGQVGLSTGSKGRRLLVTHPDPLYLLAPAHLFQNTVERVAHHTVNPRH